MLNFQNLKSSFSLNLSLVHIKFENLQKSVSRTSLLSSSKFVILQKSFELSFICDLSEINSCQIFQIWFYDLHKRIEGAFTVIKSQ